MANNLTISLVFDASTFARLAAWGGAAYTSGLPSSGGVSYALYTLGFTRQNDTGQVVWVATSATLSQAAVSGGNVVYTYSAIGAGTPQLRIGMSVTITGFVNGGNNVTATITALTGTTSGTFTVVNGTGVNETHAGTAVTTISTLPTTQATVTNGVYEIWKNGDGLTAFYIKVEYGQCAANVPGMAWTLGTGHDGAGTLSGNVSTREFVGYASATSQGATTMECDFYGTGSKWAMIMWRTNTGSSGSFYGFERSLDNTGAEYSSYVTHVVGVNPTSGFHQETLFLSGSPANGPRTPGAATCTIGAATTLAVSTFTPCLPVFPLAFGYVGNPLTILVGTASADVVEGATFTKAIYGAGTHTYIPTKAAWSNYLGGASAFYGLAMRFE